MIDEHFQIQLTINRIIDDLKKIPNHKTSVFFMGESGSGKGTLINYLIRNPHLRAEVSLSGQIVIKCEKRSSIQDEDIQISDKINSQTTVPKQTQYKGENFKDFPGFHDNRQENSVLNQDIINQFYIRDVFTKTSKFKIVFLTSKSGISDRGTEFLHSIRSFSKQFKNIKPILGSICLVVTKSQRHIQPNHIKAILQKIETQLLEELSINQKLLLRHFVQDSKIQIFHYPQKQGSLDYSQALKIQKMIQSLGYSQLHQEISINVSSKSHVKIHQLLQQWNNQISLTIPEIFQNCLGNFIEEEFLRFDEFEDHKRRLSRFMNYLEKLESISSEQHEVFLEILKNTPRLSKCENQNGRKSIIKIQELFGFINFFKSFDNQPFDVIKWKQKIYRVKHFLYELLEDPRGIQEPKRSKNQKFIHVTGFSCDSDQIQKIAQEFFSDNSSVDLQKRITVICYILNLNSNITISGTDLILISEWARVPNPVQINLKGKDAIDFEEEQNPNTDGTPGLPGQNGGNLFIKSKHYCPGLKTVRIDIRGGRGGLGKSGGQVKIPAKLKFLKLIKQDMKKSTEKKQFMIERDTYKFGDKNFIGKIAHIFRSLSTFNEQVLQKYSTIDWTEDNFFKTVGGCNGLTGSMGKIEIGKLPYEIELKKIINQKRSYGYKEVYEGVYMKEMVFPSIRKDGRPPELKRNQSNKSQDQSESSSEKKIKQKPIPQSAPSKTQERKNSIQVSDFSLDSQSSFEDFSDLEEKPQNSRTFADSIKDIAKGSDLEQQILIALFKFNKERQISKRQKEFKKFEENNKEKYEFKLIQRKNEQKEEDLTKSNDRFVRTVKYSRNFIPKNCFESNKKNCEDQKQKDEFNTMRQINPLSRSQTLNLSHSRQSNRIQNPQFNISRAQTLSFSIGEQQLRRKYLEANFQNLTKSQLFELIKIRSEAREKIITNTQERDKFALIISKELLNEFGKEIATDIGTDIIHNVGKDIVKNVSSQVAKNSGKQIGKEFLIKGSQGLGKSFVGHEIGKETIKEFSQTFSAESIKEIGKQATEKSVSIQFGIGETILGISKSFILQTIISAVLASGITDKWLIEPHFQSKKIQCDQFNEEGRIKPPPKQGLTEVEIDKYWNEFKQLIDHFETKTLNYLCQRETNNKGSKGFIE